MRGKQKEMSAIHLINTLLQRGVGISVECENRFNGFSRATETVETVSTRRLMLDTQLKQGVNEMDVSRSSDLSFLTI